MRLKALLSVAVAALAVLLLAGCQNSNKKEIPKTSAQKETMIDTTEEDTMEAFYERMHRWKALHGGMSHRESDK
jgi:outer membrane murein-binding lipoprotein Lpp